jgi:hypothetical protein
VPRGFDTHCSSVPSVDGSSRRELFEFEHSLSIGGAVWVECGGSNLLILLVPGGGVEPPRGCPRRILSPLRLPVPPSRPCIDISSGQSSRVKRHTSRTLAHNGQSQSRTAVGPSQGSLLAISPVYSYRLVSARISPSRIVNSPRAAPDTAPACHPVLRRLSP